jgi:uncharacterized protein
MTDFRIEGNNPTFWLRVKPKSRQEGLGTSSSGELCLAVHAPPTEGLANLACIRFLAESLRVPKAAIEILAGERSRRKLFRVTGMPGALARLKALAGEKGSAR